MHPLTPEQEKLLEKYRKSGMKKKVFCQRSGIALSAFLKAGNALINLYRYYLKRHSRQTLIGFVCKKLHLEFSRLCYFVWKCKRKHTFIKVCRVLLVFWCKQRYRPRLALRVYKVHPLGILFVFAWEQHIYFRCLVFRRNHYTVFSV